MSQPDSESSGDNSHTRFTTQKLVQIIHEQQENERHHNTPQAAATASFDFETMTTVLVGKKHFAQCASQGLDPALVETRRREFGSNEIPLPSIPSYLDLVVEGLNDPTLQILLASALISIVLAVVDGKNGIEGISVLLTVCIVVNVTAMTNYNKAKEFRKQQVEVDKEKCQWVVRGGEMIQVHPKDLVVGDVFRVQVGSVCPVDGFLLSPGAALSMDESALTGESFLIAKEFGNVIISGTSVMRGESLVVCCAVGRHSVSGRIFSLILQEEEEGGSSVLFAKLDELAVQVGRIGMACSLLVFVNLLGSWLLFAPHAHETWADVLTIILGFFISSVTVLVVAVPEGLPLAVTLALSVSLGRLLEDHNQVKNMDSCETMGSATTICSDKTGTLTENRMTVVAQSENGGDARAGELLKQCCALCVSPETTMTKTSNGWVYSGNATECALLRYCVERLEFNPLDMQRTFKDEAAPDLKWGSHANPFSSERKMMSIVVRDNASGEYILLVKGAPQVILANCIDLSPVERKRIYAEWKVQEDAARRVLAFAVLRNLSSKQHTSETGLTYLGWVAMEDPLREHVVESIVHCQRAGVVVRMITGDSLPTAVAIARQCRILNSNQHTYMTGAEFIERVCVKDYGAERIKRRCFDFETNQDTIALGQPFLMDGLKKVVDQEAFDEVWPNLRVLARCEPEDKLVLVSGLKSSELHLTDTRLLPQVVAVTGDGTNDAPALKASDVGFAMNHGTDVAKQAADIILLDSSFNSIVRALIWGRNVHDSVCKFLQFQMTVNVSALVLTVFGALLTSRTPLTSTQMLWVNLIMDSIGSFALATLLPNEEILLSRAPVPRDAKVITLRMMVNIVGQSLFQIGYLMLVLLLAAPAVTHGRDGEAEASLFYTKFFTTFVLMQLANELNCTSVSGSISERIHTSTKFRAIWLLTLAIQICIVQYGGVVFSSVPLGLVDWLECANVAFWGIPWQIVVVDPFAAWVENATGKTMAGGIGEADHLIGSPTPSYGTRTSRSSSLMGNSQDDGRGSVTDHRSSHAESKRRWSLVKNSMGFVNAVTPSPPHHAKEHVIHRVLRSGSVTSDAGGGGRSERGHSLDGGRRNSLHDGRDDIF